VASTTNETTRDRCQKELLGNPTDKESLGTGSIPKERIGKLTRKAGVPDAYETVLVKHISGGWSKINFKCYEQGKKKFMGYVLSGGYWCDEEPPSDIISQLNRGTTATNGIGYITFTPEEGITDVVYEYLESEKPGYGLITATWDDAPHMTPETRAQKLADYPPHEQKMRSEGKPMVGTGLIFPVPDEEIACEPFELPHHWPRIIGFDIGDDHPCGIVCAAVDRDTDSFYIYRVWRQSRALIPVIADVLKQCHGDWIPIAWPHDGMKRDTQSGRVIADIYRDDHGLNFHHERFSNPPGPGQKEGQGGQGVEAGLHAMFNAMIEGRFKVFITCTEFFDEKRMYHRKDNQVVKVKDDIMSASRYAYMMQRHAITKPTVQRTQTTKMKGLSNW
jgi:phage terminase large subunit-like protein